VADLDEAQMRDPETGLDEWPERRPWTVTILNDYKTGFKYVCNAATGERLLILGPAERQSDDEIKAEV
jgi:hypothetical protein